ncbi:hypothetical protein [Chroococcus sp. FPU101]|uniref:hypothetical protein n=1 Tax=Chroococcus sp. FPU101 TaxID=1974212 RepID=UPI001A8F9F55|nr:hypothetical protein [Chroococcus sp. FPU101]GFE67391.1 hypothetical protein CFPU101_00010 [Chroococcus sp. FPU101]
MGAKATEEKFQEYIQHLREISLNDKSSGEKVENILSLLEKIKNFFEGISWGKTTS